MKLLRLYGHVSGYVNIDIKCVDDCNKWEIHEKIPLRADGHFDVGPVNLYAAVGGFLGGPYIGVSINIAALGGALLELEYNLLTLAQEKAGPIIAQALATDPTLFCLGQGL